MSVTQKLGRGLRGAAWAPFYLAAAHVHGIPGLSLRGRIAALGLRLALTNPRAVRSSTIYDMFFFPLDSTRHFEFDFMWRSLRAAPMDTYLDVSSPRLFPALLLSARRALTATLLNPDRADLDETRNLLTALGFASRCRIENLSVENASLPKDHFDVVTSMSVIEHIRDDTSALALIWRALKTGGRLLLSLPCAAVSEEWFLNIPTYEFAEREPDGSVFHQYLYDDARLAQHVYCVTGQPVRREIVGEIRRDSHLDAYRRKWIDPRYPFWAEPWFMSTTFRRYDSIASLPGEGVVSLEFVK